MTNVISPIHWNGWHLDPSVPALIYIGEHHPGYQVDLDRMLTSDDIVFFTIQVGGKPWPGALDGFVAAVDDVYDPHRTMNAEHRPEESRYTPETIRARVAEFISQEIRNYSKWATPPVQEFDYADFV